MTNDTACTWSYLLLKGLLKSRGRREVEVASAGLLDMQGALQGGICGWRSWLGPEPQAEEDDLEKDGISGGKTKRAARS